MLDPETNDQDLFAEGTTSAPNPGQEAEGSGGAGLPDAPSDGGDPPAVKAPAKRAARSTAKKSTPRKTAAKKAAAEEPADAALDLSAGQTSPVTGDGQEDADTPPARPVKKAAPRKRATKAASRPAGPAGTVPAAATGAPDPADPAGPAGAAPAPETQPAPVAPTEASADAAAPAEDATTSGAPMVVFQAPAKKTARKRAVRKAAPPAPAPSAGDTRATGSATDSGAAGSADRDPATGTTTTTADDDRATTAQDAPAGSDAHDSDAQNPDAQNPDAQNPDAQNPDAQDSGTQDAGTERSATEETGSKKSGSGKSGGKKGGGKKGGGKKKKAGADSDSATADSDGADTAVAAAAATSGAPLSASVVDEDEDADEPTVGGVTTDTAASDDAAGPGGDTDDDADDSDDADSDDADDADDSDDSESQGDREPGEGNPRRRRRRGGRRRRKPSDRTSEDEDGSDRDGQTGQGNRDAQAASEDDSQDGDDAASGDASGSSDDDSTGDGSRTGGRGRSNRGGGRGRNGGSGGPQVESADRDDTDTDGADDTGDSGDSGDTDDSGDSGDAGSGGRRRSQGGRRGSGRSAGSRDGDQSDEGAGDDGSAGDTGADGADSSGSSDSSDSSDRDDDEDGSGEGGSSGSRRRRRRRRSGDGSQGGQQGEDRDGEGRGRRRNPEDEITSIQGSTRLEAKKQRRREGREAGRRRAPIASEAEFLARREAVDRVMVVRQRRDLTQIAVLEDKVLVEHYVARESQVSLIGNVYLGRVQNVLPSMEAAFVDIGKGRNAVIYAGEVNWAALGHKDGQPRKIESVLSSGQTILVQVTKDPIGQKGARLTGQISLPGRFLVLVPEGSTSGISRKLPDTERNRLKKLLKEIVPDTAGVIVRTAAEGASEEELTTDVERLTARWQDIEAKVAAGKGPQLLYGEPDLTLKVVRDLFTEDFAKLVIQGDDAWNLVDGYVSHVAPELRDRLEHYGPAEEGQNGGNDVFATYRVDEQIAKGLDRKVWLPSGGSLVIDRTEAMTVVDVNTGKFTGSGGNLEETVTKNNLEAAEEIVRQLRLRDIGGIIVVDFIDMVLESNRDLVLRRLVECLGRDRTRHQVAEVTSLGLVQMTRKRIGTGLLESFSHDCEHCRGRGVVVEAEPVDPHQQGQQPDDDGSRGGRNRGGRNRGGRSGGNGNGGNGNGGNGAGSPSPSVPSPASLAHSRPPEKTTEVGEDTAGAPDGVETADATPSAATPAPGDEAHQDVIGRPTPAHSEPQDVPSESATPAPGATSEGDPGSTAPEAQPEQGAPVTPAVRTTTRRRSARRPAGPPAPLVPLDQDAPMPGAGTKAGPDAEPVAVPVEPAAGSHAASDAPASPGADGSEGPEGGESAKGADAEAAPVVDATVATDLEDTAVPLGGAGGAGTTDESESGPETEVEEVVDENGVTSLVHVPVKRKGARKR